MSTIKNAMFPILTHGLRTPREEMAFTARPKIHSHSQIFRYGGSIFCLPHRPNFSDIFDFCLHWLSVVGGTIHSPSLKMSSLKSTDQGTSAIHEAATEGNLETLKRLVEDLDDKNPSIDSCTFTKTGRQYVPQEFYECHTCEFSQGVVICPVCAITCHSNHDVKYKHFSSGGGFCDCGAGDFGTCHAPSDYETPLHLAAAGGHLNILKFYQQILSDLSCVSSKGWSALHFAAYTGQLETVKYLVNYISCDIKTPTGITAYDIAKIYYHQHVVEYFEVWKKGNDVISKLVTFTGELNIIDNEECPVCLENRFGENWGLIHGDTVHIGFCETCAKRVENPNECNCDRCQWAKCPKCRASIDEVTKAYQVKTKQDESCCQICDEKLYHENWGVVHGDSMHYGYCKICANRLKNSTSPKCPHCWADIDSVLRVYF